MEETTNLSVTFWYCYADGQRFFLLGAIDGGVGGGVHDQVRLHAVEQGGQRRGVRQVGDLAARASGQGAVAAGGDQLAALAEAAVHEKAATQLAVGPEQERLHGR